MNRLGRFIAYSVFCLTPALGLAQGSSDGIPHGNMMSQEQMQKMHENMGQMQSIMQQMSQADSQEERQRLMQQHMEAMRNHMGMMGRGMMGPGMMGNHQGKNKSDNAMGKSGDMSTEQRWNMMHNRMNQMQLMMEQMLQHQQQMNRN